MDWNLEHLEKASTAGLRHVLQPWISLVLTPSRISQPGPACVWTNDDHDPQKLKRVEDHLRTIDGAFMNLFDEYDIDVIIGPGDGGVYNFFAACGKC